VGVYDLGLTTDQFYSLTPREFLALCSRHREAIERDTQRTNFLAYIFAVGNLKRDDGRPITPQDFGLTTPTREKYNGHSDMETFKQRLTTWPTARRARDDDPRLTVDSEEVKEWLTN
jgi:hypothetical protein